MDGLIERLTQADAVKPAANRQDSAARQSDAAAPQSPPVLNLPRPFYISNPAYDPANPVSREMIPDPTATAAPQAVQWTSPDGLVTTGVMNPFGLTRNNPNIGFFGAT